MAFSEEGGQEEGEQEEGEWRCGVGASIEGQSRGWRGSREKGGADRGRKEGRSLVVKESWRVRVRGGSHSRPAPAGPLRLREGQRPAQDHRTRGAQRWDPGSCLQTLEKGERHQRGKGTRREGRVTEGEGRKWC